MLDQQLSKIDLFKLQWSEIRERGEAERIATLERVTWAAPVVQRRRESWVALLI